MGKKSIKNTQQYAALMIQDFFEYTFEFEGLDVRILQYKHSFQLSQRVQDLSCLNKRRSCHWLSVSICLQSATLFADTSYFKDNKTSITEHHSACCKHTDYTHEHTHFRLGLP